MNVVPTPDLRIVPVESLHPHEEHDTQRSEPLIARIRTETTIINPPLVASMSNANGSEQFVVLDGANRVFAFSQLGYPHILVQVADYVRGFVELSNWQHVIAAWNTSQFIQHLRRIPEISLRDGDTVDAIARLLLSDETTLSVCAPAKTLVERNAALCKVVAIYQQNARLHRTALLDPDDIWPLYPDANAIVFFPPYSPVDIIAAAELKAFLPPGISRHIVQGRALRVNYSLAALCDPKISLEQKNADLLAWYQNKLANRQVRYYAEATYQFDE